MEFPQPDRAPVLAIVIEMKPEVLIVHNADTHPKTLEVQSALTDLGWVVLHARGGDAYSVHNTEVKQSMEKLHKLRTAIELEYGVTAKPYTTFPASPDLASSESKTGGKQ